MHPLLRYVLVGTPLAVLVFLGLSNFFTQWDGHAVSRRPAPSDDPAVFTVLVVTDDETTTEVDWPAELVQGLELRVEPTGTPPPKVPDTAPRTAKSRFQFYFTVTPPAGDTQVVWTTTPQAISAAVLLWLVGLALFNVWQSGSPWSWEPKEMVLPASQGGTQQTGLDPVASSDQDRPRRQGKGPPPPRPRRGGGRRR